MSLIKATPEGKLLKRIMEIIPGVTIDGLSLHKPCSREYNYSMTDKMA